MPDLQFSDVHTYMERYIAGDTNINEVSEMFSREVLCDFLRQNMDELKQEVRGMTPAQLAYRLPGAPGGWDTSGDEEHFEATQIVTHVTSGVSFHWWGMARALGHERPQFPKPPEGVAATGKNRSMMGGGGWNGVPIEEALSELDAATDRFIAYVNGLPEDVDRTATSSLGPFKHLTAHSWLFLDAVHAAMHVTQLREMQVQPDYPKGDGV